MLLLGLIVGWKRPRLALEAVALAARELPDLRLRVAGPVVDAEGARILELMRRRATLPDLEGRVEFAGPLGDPAPALARAGALLHCSDCEPFGMVLAEALASGTPVVAPASCGPAEIVDPTCGRHYLPGDAAGAARALVEVLGTPETARELGEGGRRRAAALYSLTDSRRRYDEILGDLIGPGDGGPPDTGADLTLVTVIHDSAPELGALLASVERHLPGAQVVVVDSGSSDGGAEVAARWRGGAAEVVDMGANVGFGRASNAGVERAERPVTVVLNPDVELLDGSLAELGRELLRDGAPERLLAPLVLGADAKREDNAQLEPGSPPLALHALVPPPLLPPPVARWLHPWRADSPRARRLGRRRLPGRADRHDAAARPVRPGHVPVRRGPRPRPARHRRRHRDVVLARRRACSTTAPTRRGPRSAASRSTCSRAAAARWCASGAARAARRSTTPSRRPRSRTAWASSAPSAAPAGASARSSPRCAARRPRTRTSRGRSARSCTPRRTTGTAGSCRASRSSGIPALIASVAWPSHSPASGPTA